MNQNKVKFIEASTAGDFQNLKMLLSKYAEYLNIDLSFQNFEEELNSLRKYYDKPTGCAILAFWENQIIGCIALRKFENKICL